MSRSAAVEECFLASWEELSRRLGSTAAGLGADLLSRYREGHRRYHTVEHVVAMLDRLEVTRTRTGLSEQDRLGVELAVFFHDAVYDPQRTDNESASAALAAEALEQLDVAPALRARVAQLIEVTTTHAVPDGDLAAAALVDADLSVLAQDEAGYAAYVTAVRAEYASVPDDLWRIGRAAVLQRLLDRPVLLPAGSEEEERRARENIARELATLSTRP